MNEATTANDVRRFWIAVSLGPLLAGASVVGLSLVTTLAMPMLPGMAVLLTAGMLVGLSGGTLLKHVLPAGATTAAIFTGLSVVLMYWSLRLAVGAEDGWIGALCALLIIPCFAAGAYRTKPAQ